MPMRSPTASPRCWPTAPPWWSSRANNYCIAPGPGGGGGSIGGAGGSGGDGASLYAFAKLTFSKALFGSWNAMSSVSFITASAGVVIDPYRQYELKFG